MSSMTSNVLAPEDAGRKRDNQDSDSAWSVLDQTLLLARNRSFVLTFAATVAIITAVISLLLPLRYTAATSVLPPQQNSMSSALLSQLGSVGSLASVAGGGLGLKSSDDVYVAMFHSRTVEDAMVKRFNLLSVYKLKRISDARMLFEESSTAVPGIRDGIIRVTMEASSPQVAADMANAYVDEVRKLAATLAVSEASQRRLFFDNQLAEAQSNLASAEEDLKKTELTTGMVQPDSQSRVMMESAARIQGQIAATQLQIQSMSAYATPDNPKLIVVERELAELRSQLERLTGNTGTDSDLFVPKGKIPEAALAYVRKLRNVKYRETIFEAMARQFEMAKLDEAKQGTAIQVIDPAIPPDRRSSPKRAVLVVLMTLLALFFSSFFVLIKEKLRSMSADPEVGPKLAQLRDALRWRRT
jgi:tyrosine-protein kinase Etk/Wzc